MELTIEELTTLIRANTPTLATQPTEAEPAGITNDPTIGRCCTVRTYSAGVFVGVVKERAGKEAVITDAIRIWRWEGAASLSQLAMTGPSKPSGCKFGVPVPEVVLTEVIEVIPCSTAGEAAIRAVPSWTA